jgi:predicted dehydrogenase
MGESSAGGRRSLRVLIVGAGSIGERHLRCAIQTGRATVSFCEVADALRHTIACRYPVEAAYRNIEDALESTAGVWDAAVVATPSHLHIPVALELAGRGIHLLIEKPLSVSTEGVSELASLVRERNAKAAVAYVHRAHPALAGMREAIRSGRFGKPLQLVSISGQNFPAARPAYRTIYFADRAKGGGAIQDALTHSINAAEWLIGPAGRIVADADHQALAGVNVEDTVHLMARHDSVMAAYVLNQYQMPDEFQITVTCEHATLRYEPGTNRWRWMDSPRGQWHDESTGTLERDALFTLQADQFFDCIEGKCEALCTLDEGVQTLRVGLAALRSAEHGCAAVEVKEIAL